MYTYTIAAVVSSKVNDQTVGWLGVYIGTEIGKDRQLISPARRVFAFTTRCAADPKRALDTRHERDMCLTSSALFNS